MEFKNNTQSYSKDEFLNLLTLFKNATYFQKVEIMQKYWGDIKKTTTIKYAEGNSITIGIEKNKYYFDFKCENIDLKEFANHFPDYAEAILTSSSEEEVKKKIPNFKELNLIPAMENSSDTISNIETIENVVETDYNYLNMYNNLNIKDKSKNKL